MKYQLKTQTIYCGDNLEMLKDIPDKAIDLIYIDPPFNSNRNYEVFWGDSQETRRFEDRFGDVTAYIDYMKPRTQELYRVLKDTGSFYFHCDYHASHYVKVMLDNIFTYNTFQNEIIWQRTNTHSDARRKMPTVTDSIFYYTKSDSYTLNPIYIKLSEEYLNKAYRFDDARGKYRLGDITGPKASKGESGKEWKGYNPTTSGRSWAVPNLIVEELVGKEKCKQLSVLEKLDLEFNFAIWQGINGIETIALNSLLELSQLGITFIENGTGMKVSSLNFLHGNEAGSKGGINIARNMLLRTNDNCLFGNFHKTQESSSKALDGKEFANWSIGCLCNLKPRYMPINAWNHGFATIEVSGKEFEVNNKRILNTYNVR